MTGAPGGGKTSLLEALASAGLHTVPEGARRIIREGVAAIGADPREDPAAFAAAMLAYDIAVWKAALATEGPVLFDRGLPDILAFCRLEGVDPPPGLDTAIAACRYNPLVLLAPAWPDIYRTDSERIQTPGQALESERMMRLVYPECGYRLVDLPLAPIAERVEFVRGLVCA